jgi:hypothetical protein
MCSPQCPALPRRLHRDPNITVEPFHSFQLSLARKRTTARPKSFEPIFCSNRMSDSHAIPKIPSIFFQPTFCYPHHLFQPLYSCINPLPTSSSQLFNLPPLANCNCRRRPPSLPWRVCARRLQSCCSRRRRTSTRQRAVSKERGVRSNRSTHTLTVPFCQCPSSPKSSKPPSHTPPPSECSKTCPKSCPSPTSFAKLHHQFNLLTSRAQDKRVVAMPVNRWRRD